MQFFVRPNKYTELLETLEAGVEGLVAQRPEAESFQKQKIIRNSTGARFSDISD